MATDMLEYKLFNAEDIIFKEGDTPENAYLIHMGAVEVIVGHNGGSKILDTLRAVFLLWGCNDLRIRFPFIDKSK